MAPENLPKSSLPTSIVVEQRLRRTGNTVYFVTLFDKTRTIPLYSAYKVTPSQGKAIGTYTRRQGSSGWRTTPGATGVDNAYRAAIRICKAKTGSPQLSRGHMNPSAINSFNKSYMKATYTLSNAVPQFQKFNSQQWGNQEAKIRNYAKNTCANGDGTLYMLTGISDIGLKIPSGSVNPVQDTTITQKCPEYTFTSGGTSHKLGTPRAVWSAGCCVWPTTTTPVPPAKKPRRQPVTSFAIMSNNHPDQSQLHLKQMSVADLETLLTPSGASKVKLFPGNSDCNLSKYNQML
ncbi:uncharacterized protein LOC114965455 [Acropora millepora]|uniref:uncharacterized protein LOC114965455 n=1 Tax=Acropora millepora TaxID=45264 RepID=UPI001CF2E4B4|nr:uncharacterized protein LOC114965455 [Acropora millepora]